MKYTLFHNLLTPGPLEDGGGRQLNPCPVSTVAAGTGDETCLEWEIDISGAWPAPVEQAARRITSDRLSEFVIHDSMTLDRPLEVTLRFNALKPFVQQGTTWELHLEGVVLSIRPMWEPLRAQCSRVGLDGAKRPLYQLQLEHAEEYQHTLETKFEIIWK